MNVSMSSSIWIDPLELVFCIEAVDDECFCSVPTREDLSLTSSFLCLMITLLFSWLGDGRQVASGSRSSVTMRSGGGGEGERKREA